MKHHHEDLTEQEKLFILECLAGYLKPIHIEKLIEERFLESIQLNVIIHYMIRGVRIREGESYEEFYQQERKKAEKAFEHLMMTVKGIDYDENFTGLGI